MWQKKKMEVQNGQKLVTWGTETQPQTTNLWTLYLAEPAGSESGKRKCLLRPEGRDTDKGKIPSKTNFNFNLRV